MTDRSAITSAPLALSSIGPASIASRSSVAPDSGVRCIPGLARRVDRVTVVVRLAKSAARSLALTADLARRLGLIGWEFGGERSTGGGRRLDVPRAVNLSHAARLPELASVVVWDGDASHQGHRQRWQHVFSVPQEFMQQIGGVGAKPAYPFLDGWNYEAGHKSPSSLSAERCASRADPILELLDCLRIRGPLQPVQQGLEFALETADGGLCLSDRIRLPGIWDADCPPHRRVARIDELVGWRRRPVAHRLQQVAGRWEDKISPALDAALPFLPQLIPQAQASQLPQSYKSFRAGIKQSFSFFGAVSFGLGDLRLVQLPLNLVC
jgi:hypothetical protein